MKKFLLLAFLQLIVIFLIQIFTGSWLAALVASFAIFGLVFVTFW